MANTIKHKRGTTVPTAGQLVVGELAINTTTGGVYTKTDAGGVVAVGIEGAVSWGSINGTLSNQTDLGTALGLKADLASPAFTGNPLAPTASTADNSTSLATTAFVQQELAAGTGISKAVIATVRNETGSTLAKGTVVYINGGVSNKAKVALAQANAESTSSTTYGLLQDAISTNNNGTAVISGIISGIDTSAFVAGTMLYLSPTTAGELTSTKPSAPNHLVSIGVVTYQHANQGAIQLRIANGFELSEIHDVAISSPANNNFLVYETSSTLWKNKSASTLGIAELSGATFTGKISATQSTTSAGIRFLNQNTYPTTATAQNGDMWLTEYNLQYKDSTGTVRTCVLSSGSNTFTSPQVFNNQSNQTLPAVRINNLATLATAHSFVVEDNTNPDTTAFIVDNAGNVGVNVDPATWTAANKLEVNGSITSTTPSTGTNSTVVATTAYVKANLSSYATTSALTSALTEYTPTASLNNQLIATDVTINYSDYYTLTASDANSVIQINGAGAVSSHLIYLPTNLQAGIPIGSQVVFVQMDNYAAIFSASGGANVYCRGARTTMNGIYAVATAIKVDTDTWVLSGDLV